MNDFRVKDRKDYLDRLMDLVDNENILLITGMRRSGKTSLSLLLEDALKSRNADSRVYRLNMEANRASVLTWDALVSDIEQFRIPGKKTYLILDEITQLTDWERAVNSLSQSGACKLILISSNRALISSGLDMVRDGCCDVVEIFPMSLPEFMEYHGFQEKTGQSAGVSDKRYQLPDGREYSLEDAYSCYLTYGGLSVFQIETMNSAEAQVILDGVYSSLVTRDVMEYRGGEGEGVVSDPGLLRNVNTVLAKHTGSNMSATWISRQVKLKLFRQSSTKTVESYLRAMMRANVLLSAERLDLRSNQKLKTLPKYFYADTGLRNLMTGFHTSDGEMLLENTVLMELLRRGYQVLSGKIGREQVQLVAISGERRNYIQVATELNAEKERSVLSPLRKVKDSYPKFVLVLHGENRMTQDGIQILNALEFLMGRELVLQ
ncbi:MAG: ATP-binding protein [Oscillospiraceae bacterium]|nr:ATP-binding protein [Oscillospiraceae bacterium]